MWAGTTGAARSPRGCRSPHWSWCFWNIRTSSGYTGAIPYLAGGLALGSWLATLIAGVPMILLCRTLLEDKMLREELAGYEEYAAQVKYRLALGIW